MNGARFPIVSPAGTLIGSGGPKGRIVDGGYFENGGLETMLDLARFLATRMKRERRIILIEIDNGLPENSSNVPPDFQRYPNRSDDETVLAIDLQVTRLTEQRTSPFSEVTSIVGGLYGTRSSRGVLAAKRLSGAYAVGIDVPVSRITFNLPRLGNGAAMSWSLSPRSREDIDDLLDPSKNLESIVRGGGPDRALAECQRLVADRLAALLFAQARARLYRHSA